MNLALRYRAEWIATLRLAWPIWLTQIIHIFIGVTETVMNGSHSTLHLASLALGTGIWLPIQLFSMGVMMAASPLAGKLVGKQRERDVGPLSCQGIYISLVVSLIGATLMLAGREVIDLLTIDDQIKTLSRSYLFITCLALLPLNLAFNLRFCFEGIGYTKAALVSECAGLITSVLVNYFLVFGFGPIPSLGVIGSAWANVIVSGVFLLSFWSLGICLPRLKSHQWLGVRIAPDITLLRRWLGLGLPIGTALCAEGSLFAVVALIIAPFGEIQVAAHQIALSFTTIAYMLPFSVSMAITVRVSQAYGQENPQEIGHRIAAAGIMSLLPAVFNSVLLLIGLLWVVPWYTADPEVQAYAKLLFLIAMMYQFSDAIQSCFLGVLRGVHDTFIAMLISITSYWLIGLPSGYWLAYHLGMATQGMWYAMIISLTFSAIFLGLRVKQHHFKA